jgi:DNA-binding transcriptional LysR family regulator
MAREIDPDWNDWRAFLAVARSGSTLAAAQLLKVSQTTVARRTSELEAALGLLLFERRRDGCALTEAGKLILPRAEAIEAAASMAQNVARSFARSASGTVRLTAHEIFAVLWLTPALKDFRKHYPHIRIEVDTCDEFRDLAAGEADVALRSAWYPNDPCLVGRRLCDEDWTFYAGHSYAAQHGVPSSISELDGHALLGGGGSAWPAYENWLRRYGLLSSVILQHSSIAGLLAAVRQGLGLSALPCWVAEGDPGLIRCFPPPKSGRGLWLLSHETRCRQPHVRAVIDFLYEKLSANIKATKPWPIRVDPQRADIAPADDALRTSSESFQHL